LIRVKPDGEARLAQVLRLLNPIALVALLTTLVRSFSNSSAIRHG
jgi:hypothetical protein